MKKKGMKLIASAAILVLAVVVIVMGIIGMNQRGSEVGAAYLADMRNRAVLVATGEGAVESYVKIAGDKARAEAKAAAGGMSAIREAVAAAEEEARNNSSASMLDYATADITGLDAALNELTAALTAYYNEADAAQAAYVAEMEASGAMAAEEAPAEDTSELSEADLDAAMMAEEETVDLSGFDATAEM